MVSDKRFLLTIRNNNNQVLMPFDTLMQSLTFIRENKPSKYELKDTELDNVIKKSK